MTKDEVPVPLGDRAFDILLVLLDHAPEIVGKAALFQQVWQGAHVEESTLRYQISTLRKALGDGADGARYITNVTGQGYCFVAGLSRLAADPPAPISVDRPITNLPLRLSEIVGRERELAELEEWLTQHRMITLTGPGGVGKTRLAVELGHRAFKHFAAGVWLIDLAPITDRKAVPGAVAVALGIAVAKTEALVDEIVAALSRAEVLLIFDNCEHLTDEAAKLIRRMLERAPRLSVVATSQKPLHLEAERIYGLDPLRVPPAEMRDIRGFSAVEFFLSRVRAADRMFQLDEGNSAGIAEICRQLDGLPLALEMAAGRLRTLGIMGLRRGLVDRLNLLRGQPHGEARHRSLLNMVEWSHSLLLPLDQRVFRRLAIFPGSFSLEAAMAVAGIDGVRHWEALDAFARLVDHSLVTLERREPARYRLLETLRLYAKEQLRQAGEEDLAAELHATHFITVFDEAERSWEEMPEPDWTARYLPELDNLKAGLDWALAHAERRRIATALAAAGFALTLNLTLVWDMRPYENQILPMLDADTPAEIAARLLSHLAHSRLLTRDPNGSALAERAASIFWELGDRPRLANVLLALASYRMLSGKNDEVQSLVSEARVLLSADASRRNQMRLMMSSGLAAHNIQDNVRAKQHLVAALDLSRQLRSRLGLRILTNLALIEYASGEIDRAVEHSNAALDLSQGYFGYNGRGIILSNLAAYLIAGDRLGEARLRLSEAFSVLVDRRDYWSKACLMLWAVLASREGFSTEAAQLVGFVDADRMRRGFPVEPAERPLYDRLMRTLEATLPPPELDRWKAMGAAWNEDEAINFVAARLIQAPA